MSTVIDYYLAIENENGKIDFFPNLFSYEDVHELITEGENKGKWKKTGSIKKPSVIEWHYASPEYETYEFERCFVKCDEKELSEDLIKAFTTTNWNGEKSLDSTLEYAEVSDILELSDEYIKKGYFLVEDIARYEETKDADELFYNHIGAIEYSNLAAKQIKQSTYKDEYGDEHIKYGYEDYMYYAYPDYQSLEYLIHKMKIVINTMKNIFLDYNDRDKIKCYLLRNCN